MLNSMRLTAGSATARHCGRSLRRLHVARAASSSNGGNPKKQLRSLLEDIKQDHTSRQRKSKGPASRNKNSQLSTSQPQDSNGRRANPQQLQPRHRARTPSQSDAIAPNSRHPQHGQNTHKVFSAQAVPAVPGFDDGQPSTSGRDSILEELQRERFLEQMRARGGHVDLSKIKYYPPVRKGALELPGGPSWQALRRHIRYDETPGVPDLRAIILVEGKNDQEAVSKAVNAPVYVCGGERVLREHVEGDLLVLPRLGWDLVVLTDPDSRGRTFRVKLDELLGPLRHAFIPEASAVTLTGTRTKEAGNLGVEHAAPQAIRRALATATASFGGERREFTREMLVEWQLMNDVQRAQVPNIGLRRRLLCSLLGVGDCDGSQLVAVLNRFFTVAELQNALQEVDEQLAAAGVELGGKQLSRNSQQGDRLLKQPS